MSPNLNRAAFLESVNVRPNRYGLLLWLQEHVTAADIERVAAADAGFDLDDNRRALTKLLNAGEVRGRLDVGESWLTEICGMTMVWQATDDWGLGERRSVVLACVVQILGGAPGESLADYINCQSDPVGVLIANVRYLGEEACRLAAAMLADGVQRFDDSHCIRCGEPDDLFCGLGMVALTPDVPDEALAWLLDLEAAWFARDIGSNDMTWLWRLTFFDQSKPIWREELLAAAARGVASPIRARLADHVRTWGDG